MLGLSRYENLIIYLQLAAIVGVLIRFLTAGLQRVYRFFFCYLVVLAGQGLFPLMVRRGTNLYGYVFIGIEGVIVLLYALIVLELYSLVLRNLPGIASISRRYIKIALGVAILISLMLLQLEQIPHDVMARFFSFESTIVFSLVFFVFLITAFLVYYPIPLNRNVIFYSIGYAFYFTSKALALFLRNTGHQWDAVFSFLLLGVSTACLIFWIFSLSRAGEQKTVVFGHKWNREDERYLLEQLDAINRSLMRVRK
jgi:hypothetical protein